MICLAMKLPFGKAQTEPFEKVSPETYILTGYEQSSQETFDVVKLPIFNEENITNCVYSYKPIRMIPDINCSGHWLTSQAEEPVIMIQPEEMSGEFYRECSDGIYNKNDENKQRRIFDIKVKFIKVIEIWSNESLFKKKFVCQISSTIWQGQSREIIIDSEKYKDLFKEIHKRFPEIFLPDTGSEIVQEYLTDVFRRDHKTAEIIVQAEKIGWLNVHGNVQYMLGINDFYQTYKIPNVSAYDRKTLFENGIAFLNVGNENETISTIWLTAHIALSNYWFEQGGKKFTSVVYLQGETNLLKTSVVKVTTNPFDTNRNNATIRMTSTSAGIRYSLSMLPDTFICVDDFSNTELTSSRKSLENAEDVIRAVGDGVFPIKMNVKDFSQSVRESIRATIILTGEENLPLGTSSQYRIVTLPIEKETFNGDILRHFQNHPEIMSQYFALYIQYLTERGRIISSFVSPKITEYTKEFAQELSVRRFVETAAFFKLQTDILYDFAIWCGVNKEEVSRLYNVLLQNIILTMTRNQVKGTQLKPTSLFLYALWQSLNSSQGTILAESKNQYFKDESKFIGFHDKAENLIWIKPNEAYSIVRKYCEKEKKSFLVQSATIKRLLVEEGYAEGNLQKNGGMNYVHRLSQGNRIYMLVLKVEEIEKALESIQGEC